MTIGSWSKANMPLVAGYFRFTVTIPTMGTAHLREFHGLSSSPSCHRRRR
jgi:hypothetical protein